MSTDPEGSARKKVSGLSSKLGFTRIAPSRATRPRPEKGGSVFSPPGYVVRSKHLGKFHRAVHRGEFEEARKLFYYDKTVLNKRDKKDRTALHLACANKDAQVVTFLLGQKCELNPCDGESRTPLMKAVQCQAQDHVTVLLEHGADPNVVDIYGNSALHYAAFNGDLSIAATLRSHGASMETANKDQFTPLLLALSERKMEVAEFLINEKADVNVVDDLKRTPLMLAVRCGSSSTVSLLLQQNVDIFAEDCFGRTAEAHAVANGSDIFCQQILEYKEKMNSNPQNSNPDEITEDPGIRLSDTLDCDDDLWHTSDIEDFNSYTKNVAKLDLKHLATASQQTKKNLEAQHSNVRTNDTDSIKDRNSESPKEDVVEDLCSRPTRVPPFIPKIAFKFDRPYPRFLFMPLNKFPTTEEEEKMVECGISVFERDPPEQTRSGKEEDEPSLYLESISEDHSEEDLRHLPGAANQKEKNTVNTQAEGSPEKHHKLKATIMEKVSSPEIGVRTINVQPTRSAKQDFDTTSEQGEQEPKGRQILAIQPTERAFVPDVIGVTIGGRRIGVQPAKQAQGDFVATSQQVKEDLQGREKNHPQCLHSGRQWSHEACASEENRSSQNEAVGVRVHQVSQRILSRRILVILLGLPMQEKKRQ
nr:putative POTE ankyrin domain family member M isoform X10 [Microcebus murinus]